MSAGDGEFPVRLRDVRPDDLDVYVRLRCDPTMMADLGGPLPRDSVLAQLRYDLDLVSSGAGLIRMVVLDGAPGRPVVGTVTLWSHELDGEALDEVGWMVLPQFQGRGLAKRAVRLLLDQARAEGDRRVVHAFPTVGNGPSNGICRSLGFTLLGERRIPFRDRMFRSNHWVLDLTRSDDAG